jgi:hypothetical protein
VDKSKSHSDAVERFQAAREERDRRAGLYEAASGSPSSELTAFTEVQAAEEQLATREAWLKWTERDYQIVIRRAGPTRTEMVRNDERRAEKLRQVRRRIKNGSSMVTRMARGKRAAHVKREHRRRRP